MTAKECCMMFSRLQHAEHVLSRQALCSRARSTALHRLCLYSRASSCSNHFHFSSSTTVQNSRGYATRSSSPEVTVLRQGATPELAQSSQNGVKSSDLLVQVAALQSQGKKVAVQDKDGETHILAQVPEDIRTYTWRTSEWSWGVTERLFQDCEQAKMSFELEEYIDQEDGRTKKRVVADGKGQHIGHGNGWWFDAIGLPKTFNTWATVCFVHMWILKVRIRQLPKQMSEHWTELLTNHFFWEAEKTMDFVHKMTATQRKEHLEIFSQIWRGSLLAYDEGLVKGDAVLAAAIWRQLFNSDPDTDPLKIVLVTAYVRREVARVAQLSDKVLARGYIGFGKPISETDILMQSPTMRVPFASPSTTSKPGPAVNSTLNLV